MLWAPKDEIEFMRGLINPAPGSCLRGQTSARRIECLRKALGILRVREFPGWQPGQLESVIAAGEKMLERAEKEAGNGHH
jgi:hypothetical protein